MPNYERALWADGSKVSTEIWEEERRRKELNKPGAMLFNRVGRKKKVQLKDSTGFKDLQSQFDSADNRGQTVRQQVSDYNGLGSGRIIIKGKTNTPEGIFFYPDDPVFDKKAVESVAGWGRVFNAPAEFAPLLGTAIGGKKLLNQRGLNKAKRTYERVNEDLNIADSFNVTPTNTVTPRGLQILNNNNLKVSGNRPAHQVRNLPDWWKRPLKITKKDQVKMGLNQPMAFTEQDTLKIYPGNNKINQARRQRILADNPTAAAYRELLDKHAKLTENSESITIGKKQVKVNPLSKEEFEADVNKLIELKKVLNLPSPKQFSEELGTIVIDGNSYRWGKSKGGLVPEKVIPEGEMSPLQKRAFQLDPANHPGPVNWWRQAQAAYKPATQNTPEIGIHPDIEFEDFRAFNTKTANIADNLTTRLAKLWNLNKPTEGVLGSFPTNMKIDGKGPYLPRADAVDKGHMYSAKTGATNLGMSQLVETNLGNRRMGKLNAFERRVMEILDVPAGGGRGKLASGKEPKSAYVKQQLAERDQEGWMKAVSDYVANRKVDPITGEIVITENRDAILTQPDKLRLQYKLGTTPTVNRKGIWSIPISGQEQAAMQIMTERRIAEVYFEAGLGETPDEMAILKQVLKEASAEEQVLKAQYISKEGQEFRARKKKPLARQEEIEADTKELWGLTIKKGGTDKKQTTGLSIKEKVTQLPSKATGRPKFRSEDEALDYYLKELKKHFDETGSISKPSKQ